MHVVVQATCTIFMDVASYAQFYWIAVGHSAPTVPAPGRGRIPRRYAQPYMLYAAHASVEAVSVVAVLVELPGWLKL